MATADRAQQEAPAERSAAAARRSRAVAQLALHGPLLNRLGGAMAANGAARFVALAVQLLSLAILPREWGAERFGLWLMISAAATYLALGDLGLSAAGGAEMTLAIARGDPEGAGQVFRAGWRAASCATAAAVAVGLAATAGGFAAGVIGGEAAQAIALVVLYGAAVVQSVQMHEALRASGRYVLAAWLVAGWTACDGAAVILAVAAGGGLAAAAAALLAARAACAAVLALLVLRLAPWVRRGPPADVGVRRRLLRPAAANLALTLSGALSLQGVVVALGLAASPLAAATYASARVIARAPLQVSAIVVRASLTELTTAHGAGRHRRFRRLTLANAALSLAILIPAGLAVALVGEPVARRLTGSAVAYPAGLFPLLALGAAFLAVSAALTQSAAAVNRHGSLGAAHLGLAVAMAASPFLLGRTGAATVAVAAAAAACEGLGVLLSLGTWRALTRTPA